jgi:hypothetical protein
MWPVDTRSKDLTHASSPGFQTRVQSGVVCTVLLLLLLLGSRHVVLAEICWSLAARTLDCAQLVPGVRAGAACAGRIGRGVR